MPPIKPSLTERQVRTLLQCYFDQPITRLTPIEGGHISRTFSFCCAATDYIVRFAKGVSGANFAKSGDETAYRWVRSRLLAIFPEYWYFATA